MSLKRTDLAKNLNLKIQGQMQHAAVPSRFAQTAVVPDRREQRKLDQAAGLVPFAVKLNKELVVRLSDLASTRQVTLNALVDEVLRAGLAQLPAAASAAPKVAAKKAAVKPTAKTAAKAAKPSDKKGAADQAPAKKASAKKVATRQAAAKTPTPKTAKKAAR